MTRSELIERLRAEPKGLQLKDGNSYARAPVVAAVEYLRGQHDAGGAIADLELAETLLDYMLEPAVRRDVEDWTVTALGWIAGESAEVAESVVDLVVRVLGRAQLSKNVARTIWEFLHRLRAWADGALASSAIRGRAADWVALAERFAAATLAAGSHDNRIIIEAADMGVSFAEGSSGYAGLIERGLVACLCRQLPNTARTLIPQALMQSTAINAAPGAWRASAATLVRRSLDAFDESELAHYDQQGASLSNMACFVWAGQALSAISLARSCDIAQPLFQLELSSTEVNALSRMVEHWLENCYGNPMRDIGFVALQSLDGRPDTVIELVESWLQSQVPRPRYLARVAFRLDLVDESCLHPEDRPRLPPELPLSVRKACELMNELRVVDELTDGTGRRAAASARREAARACGLDKLPIDVLILYKTNNGVEALLPMAQVAPLLGEFRKTLELHQLAAGQVQLGPLGVDVRHHRAPARCLPLGRADCGDILFVDPLVRVEQTDTVPLLRYHHERPFECSIEALSVGHFVALEVARALMTRRETMSGLDQYLHFEATLKMRSARSEG